MGLVLIIVILVIVFSGGSGLALYPHYGVAGGFGPLGLILIALLIMYLFGMFG
jgi:hypothetical protein